jgi:hypothetical protein
VTNTSPSITHLQLTPSGSSSCYHDMAIHNCIDRGVRKKEEKVEEGRSRYIYFVKTVNPEASRNGDSSASRNVYSLSVARLRLHAACFDSLEMVSVTQLRLAREEHCGLRREGTHKVSSLRSYTET